MSRDDVENVARAILYEGYVLYPYRPSVKNRQRWTFGGLYPKSWSDAEAGSDAWMMQAECLVEVAADALSDATVNVVVQFLHLLDRTVGELPAPADELPAPGDLKLTTVDSVIVDGAHYNPWQEAVERRLQVGAFRLCRLLESPHRMKFSFPEHRAVEAVRKRDGRIAAVLIRHQQAIAGEMEVFCTAMADGLFKVTVRVLNRTDLPAHATRDDALLRSLASTHAILGASCGRFVSAIDPPEKWRAQAESCRNIGAWPVLIGQETQADAMLCAPIILYDYPRLAPESSGDLFDGTEIDEILTLRILTLTDEEKRSAAGNDERVRALLARTESLARENLMGLHGVFRPVAPAEPSHG